MSKILESLEKRRVHLADRHTMFADLVENHIKNCGFAEICARSDSLRICRDNLKKSFASKESEPDLLLLDINDSNGKMVDYWWSKKEAKEEKPSVFTDFSAIQKMFKIPEDNGLVFCEEIRAAYPKLKILAYSEYTHWYPIRELKKMRIGHVSKYASIGDLIIGIGASLEGKIYHCERSEHIVRKDNPNFWFTPREKQLVSLIPEDYTSGEIAIIMGLEKSTVESMRKHLGEKMLTQLGHQNIVKETMLMGLIRTNE